MVVTMKNAIFWDDVSEERITSIIRVTRISRLETLAVTNNPSALQRNIKATQCNIPEDGILHRHCCGNLKSYICESVYDSPGNGKVN
jgi:hypothetical protein